MPTAMEMVALQRTFPAEYGRWEGIRIGRALVLRGQVDVPTLPKRRNVAVCFRGPPSRVRPVVMVSGPTHSRHRFVDYRPTSLCLYFGPDPQSMKWNINDGLVGLVDLIRQHLFKEEWWRATRQWSGAEVHLDPAPVRPGAVPHSQRPKARLQRRRQPCWCGNSRYSSCHGAVPLQEELQLLGIDTNPLALREEPIAATGAAEHARVDSTKS
jgi:hypothetical protein